MYGDEFCKIKEAVDHYAAAAAEAERLQKCRQSLELRRKDGDHMLLSFVGTSATVDIPSSIQSLLFVWLDDQLLKKQAECARFQTRITCPAGTNDRGDEASA